MATAIISAGQAGRNGAASGVPISRGVPRASASVTPSGTSAVATVIAHRGEVLTIWADTACALSFAVGANPDASTDPQFGVGAGGEFALHAEDDDTRVAIVTVV